MSDYCPPGLGRSMEDLISKHTSKMPAKESIYQWAIRNAERTRKTLAAMGCTPPPPPPSPYAPRKERVVLVNERRPTKGNGAGRKAYHWGLEHGKTCKEAAAEFQTTVASIQSYRIKNSLPSLKDGRVNSGNYKRHRRKAEEIHALCVAAVREMQKTKQSVYTIAQRRDLSPNSIIRHCIHQGIPWNK